MRIYKILDSGTWATALAAGQLDGVPIDIEDGYIHFSTADQLRETAAKHFAGQHDLMLIGVDAERFDSALKWEPSRGGALFPHLYAPLLTDLVDLVAPLPLGPEGGHIFPAEIP